MRLRALRRRVNGQLQHHAGDSAARGRPEDVFERDVHHASSHRPYCLD